MTTNKPINDQARKANKEELYLLNHQMEAPSFKPLQIRTPKGKVKGELHHPKEWERLAFAEAKKRSQIRLTSEYHQKETEFGITRVTWKWAVNAIQRKHVGEKVFQDTIKLFRSRGLALQQQQLIKRFENERRKNRGLKIQDIRARELGIHPFDPKSTRRFKFTGLRSPYYRFVQTRDPKHPLTGANEDHPVASWTLWSSHSFFDETLDPSLSAADWDSVKKRGFCGMTGFGSIQPNGWSSSKIAAEIEKAVTARFPPETGWQVLWFINPGQSFGIPLGTFIECWACDTSTKTDRKTELDH